MGRPEHGRENMTTTFTSENTSGYTDEQIDELNRRLAAAIADLDPGEYLYDERVQAEAERVQAEYDDEIAPANRERNADAG